MSAQASQLRWEAIATHAPTFFQNVYSLFQSDFPFKEKHKQPPTHFTRPS
jgi:hypothetical protein